MNQPSTKPEPAVNRRSTRVIQSKIGRYIRGEISADLIHKSNVQVVCTNEGTIGNANLVNNHCASNRNRQQITNAVVAVNATNAISAANVINAVNAIGAANAVAAAAAATVPQIVTTIVDNAKHKTRPPFRNTVNAKSSSFVSAVNDMKRMKLDESKTSANNVKSPKRQVSNDVCACLAEPDVPSMCLCDYDAMKKFVPEPGAYLHTIKRKLSHIRHRNADRELLTQVLSHYDNASEDNENFEIWQCN